MKYTFTSLLFLLSTFSFSQKLTFDIFLFGNVIGQTVVERSVKNDSITQYTLNNASEAHIFFTTKKFSLHYDITYKRDRYFSSYSKHTRNDEVHITTIQWQGNKYVMKIDNVASNIFGLVDCSTVKLFFAEPCSATQIFSERLGEYRVIKKREDGVYQAEMTEGITYYYHYKDGKLVELEMRKGFLGSIYVRPHQ